MVTALLWSCNRSDPFHQDDLSGWCYPASPEQWPPDSRPWRLPAKETQPCGLVDTRGEEAAGTWERLSDDLGCEGWRFSDALAPGTYTDRCEDWSFAIDSGPRSVPWIIADVPAPYPSGGAVFITDLWLVEDYWWVGGMVQTELDGETALFNYKDILVKGVEPGLHDLDIWAMPPNEEAVLAWTGTVEMPE